jgi:DNA-binding NarL/FixJ family response regulator
MGSSPTRILLVEDHQVLRDGLKSLLQRSAEFIVVAEAGDGVSALDLAKELQPDIVVMDLWLPRLSGVEATRRIVAACPRCKVLVLSQRDGASAVHQALEAGAAGYVVKTSSVDQLLTAARAVRDGQRYLPAALERDPSGASGPGSRLSVLSGREIEVLQLIGEGYSSRRIAETLGISERTVDAHRANIMSKLGAHKATDLVRLAIREGLIAP